VASVNARRLSIRSQLRAGAKLSLASLVVFALARLLAVGADGGAPALLANAPYSVMLADGGAPAVLALAPLSVMLGDEGVVNIRAFFVLFPHHFGAQKITVQAYRQQSNQTGQPHDVGGW